MAFLGLLGCQVAKVRGAPQAIRISILVWRETVVFQVHRGLQADQVQKASLAYQGMDLLDIQEIKEMLVSLACLETLEFQARKENLAMLTSKEFLDHLDLKGNLVYLETQVTKELQVSQDNMVYQDRKEKEVMCRSLGGLGFED